MANILVIDDEAILLSLICTVLRAEGHTVRAVSDPLLAMDAFGPGEPPIDLLLSEIDTKPITGLELVKRLSKATFTSQVLFTSGYMALARAVATSLGTRSILEKPFTAGQLRTAVNRSLAKRRTKPSAEAGVPVPEAALTLNG